MVVEGPENEEVDGFEGDLAPDQDYHEGSPLALDVIAGLQPAHVEVAFDWTTNSSVGQVKSTSEWQCNRNSAIA